MSFIGKTKSLVTLICSKPYDISTKEGQRNERARRIAQTAAMGTLAKIINVLAGLITVPLTLPYFGAEKFGIWMALTGFVVFLSFADFGMSIGLQSSLTKCFGSNNKAKPSYYISSSLFLITLISCVIMIISYLIIQAIDISSLIDVSKDLASTANATAVTILLVFILGVPAGLFLRVFIAYQEGVTANATLVIGRLLGLVSVFFCVYLEQSLPVMVFLYTIMPSVIVYIAAFRFIKQKAYLAPRFTKISFEYVKDMSKVGFQGLRAQIGATVMTNGPLMVLAVSFGAKAIVPFVLSQRILSVLIMAIGVFLEPLWPAYGEAIERNDVEWIKNTLRKSLLLALLLSVPFAFLFVFSGQQLVSWWANSVDAIPSKELLIVCGIWGVLQSFNSAFSMFLNGLNCFLGQAYYGLIFPLLGVFFGLWLSDSYSLPFCFLVMVVLGDGLKVMMLSIESYLKIRHLTKNHALV
ncbi:O157 family O-antigen flippase [Colwellia sp. KU-HH00111]|uniref:hypothetical protein n=1 Tax=Colwellia sp. KU-HH00111 TaxID=3127652 RepID=UPI003106527C